MQCSGVCMIVYACTLLCNDLTLLFKDLPVHIYIHTYIHTYIHIKQTVKEDKAAVETLRSEGKAKGEQLGKIELELAECKKLLAESDARYVLYVYLCMHTCILRHTLPGVHRSNRNWTAWPCWYSRYENQLCINIHAHA